jgi:hypothetical protein
LVVVRMAWVFPGTVLFWQIMRIDRIGGTGTLQELPCGPSKVLHRAVKIGLVRE